MVAGARACQAEGEGFTPAPLLLARRRADVAEPVDAADLKSVGPRPSGFESRRPHHQRPRAAIKRPVLVSQTRAVASPVAAATCFPSALNATPATRSTLGSST